MERETYGVKEVDDGDKGGVEEGPDDVEFPLQGLDADGCDFDNLMRGRRRISPAGSHFPRLRKGEIPMKLNAQFEAVPNAAPFVRILIELISVG